MPQGDGRLLIVAPVDGGNRAILRPARSLQLSLRTVADDSPPREGRALFHGVPSMFDSLEVEVLYPA